MLELRPRRRLRPLNRIARHQINISLIAAPYDDLLRVAGSLLQRHTTGSQLMSALRSHTRHLATLGRAIAHVGRAAKTIHLLDFCNDEPFRRRILERLTPLGHEHITLTGRYRITLPEQLQDRAAYRALKTPNIAA